MVANPTNRLVQPGNPNPKHPRDPRRTFMPPEILEAIGLFGPLEDHFVFRVRQFVRRYVVRHQVAGGRRADAADGVPCVGCLRLDE